MTRHRKGLRPLSQMGLINVPRSALQRTVMVRTKLESFNEHATDERQLHPTKGWRKLSAKRGRAQYLVAEILSGQGRSLAGQRRMIVHGY